ncbi:MAG: carboxypeptidase-like regulatory domain-containing protein, partial [Draconibacterium sp.]|nr:carboxypeptidase-like regulatory domain-containing protein [Draconibacterium sp.]
MAIYLFIVFPNSITAQNKKLVIIEGVVTDTLFKAIPFANISIEGTTAGTISNIEGYYKLELNKTSDSLLIVSCIGYKTEKIKFSSNLSQKINIRLIPKNFEIDEVV